MHADEWSPEVIVSISGGGLVPARIIREHFSGVPVYVVGLMRYNGQQAHEPQIIQWLDRPEQQVHGKRVLVVDEMDDTRESLALVCQKLLDQNPSELRTAVVHNKEVEKHVDLPEGVAHSYVGQTVPDEWIVYPWETTDITDHDSRTTERPPMVLE